MRSLFLILLLANLLFFAVQQKLFGDLVHEARDVRPDALNAERLRIIRDTSAGGLAPKRATSNPAQRAQP